MLRNTDPCSDRVWMHKGPQRKETDSLCPRILGNSRICRTLWRTCTDLGSDRDLSRRDLQIRAIRPFVQQKCSYCLGNKKLPTFP